MTRLIHDSQTTSTSNALSSPVVDKSEDETPDIIRNKQFQPPPCQKKSAGRLSIAFVQPGKTAVILGALSGVSVASAAPSFCRSSGPVISVNDVETLFKIGRDDHYPLNGNYQQTADIDTRNLSQSIGTMSRPFTGQYDGKCHTIENLQHCLVKKLDFCGSISNLRFVNPYISTSDTAGVAACLVVGTVSDIQFENASVFTSGFKAFAGIGGGSIYGTVRHTTAVGCMVTTSGDGASAGIGAGEIMGNAKIERTSALNSTIIGNLTNIGNIPSDVPFVTVLILGC